MEAARVGARRSDRGVARDRRKVRNKRRPEFRSGIEPQDGIRTNHPLLVPSWNYAGTRFAQLCQMPGLGRQVGAAHALPEWPPRSVLCHALQRFALSLRLTLTPPRPTRPPGHMRARAPSDRTSLGTPFRHGWRLANPAADSPCSPLLMNVRIILPFIVLRLLLIYLVVKSGLLLLSLLHWYYTLAAMALHCNDTGALAAAPLILHWYDAGSPPVLSGYSAVVLCWYCTGAAVALHKHPAGTPFIVSTHIASRHRRVAAIHGWCSGHTHAA